MEKHIYEIVYCGISVEQYDKEFIDDVTSVAKKITTNMTKFIGWMHDNTDDTMEEDNSLWWVIPLEEYVSIETMYKYWMTNIKHK